MKFLAIEKNIPEIKWENSEQILKDEAQRVYQLYLSGYLSEIYFNECRNAVLILECESKNEALELLNSLPLVLQKMITFEIMELKPYTGFERIITQQ